MAQGVYLGKVLEQGEVMASAPCRLDIGGTWDLKAFALLYKHILPTTTNIALSLRTRVSLMPYRESWIKISDITASEEYRVDDIHFDTRFGLLFAIASHFNIHGVEIQLSYESPPRCGLGGSGVLAVITIGALSKACELVGMDGISKAGTVELAHDIEDGLRYSYTGMQDQCAAAYGGVNRWTWTYASSTSKFGRQELLHREDYDVLEKRVVLAYIGEAHDSRDVNEQQVAQFLNGHARKPWFRINEIANEFASAITACDWEKAGSLIGEETEIRIGMVPNRITPIGQVLWEMAKEYSAGFATAGAGNGGCVWALCREPEHAVDLKLRWAEMLRDIETARVLDTRIDSEGLEVRSPVGVLP